MTIPRFTAEFSLSAYRTAGVVRRRQRMNSRGAVTPALAIDANRHACYNLCRGGAAYPGCLEECSAALGGSGGGGGHAGGTGPELHCGPCINKKRHCVLPGVGGGTFPCTPGMDD